MSELYLKNMCPRLYRGHRKIRYLLAIIRLWQNTSHIIFKWLRKLKLKQPYKNKCTKSETKNSLLPKRFLIILNCPFLQIIYWSRTIAISYSRSINYLSNNLIVAYHIKNFELIIYFLKQITYLHASEFYKQYIMYLI